MDPEIKQELAAIHALVKDNHDMLRAIRRGQWYSFIFKVLLWTGAIVIPLYLYAQFIGPNLGKFSPAGAPGPKSSFGIPSSAELQNLIKLYTGGQ